LQRRGGEDFPQFGSILKAKSPLPLKDPHKMFEKLANAYRSIID